MIKAGGKQVKGYSDGQVVMYHTVEVDGKRFSIGDMVKITSRVGDCTEGKIRHISRNSVHIFQDGSSTEIKFTEIKDIRY